MKTYCFTVISAGFIHNKMDLEMLLNLSRIHGRAVLNFYLRKDLK